MTVVSLTWAGNSCKHVVGIFRRSIYIYIGIHTDTQTHTDTHTHTHTHADTHNHTDTHTHTHKDTHTRYCGEIDKKNRLRFDGKVVFAYRSKRTATMFVRRGTFFSLLRPSPSVGRRTLNRNCGSGPRPLDGVRVIDMTRVAAGPYCAMILADMGADVIKVERPTSGDDSRGYGPPFVDIRGPGDRLSLYFASLNRNKRSVCVDFRHADGKTIVEKLVRRSHVLIENYVPGTLQRHGVGYEDLRKINPTLVYCSITGYGSRGPWKQKPGYDCIAASVGGLMNATGDAVPAKAAVPVTDLMTGMYAHGAILAALYRGVGDKIDCDLLSTQLAMMINLGSNYLNAGMLAKRWGTEHESLVPYKAFQTSNGFLTLGTGNEAQFQSFCERISAPGLPADERFADNACRVKNRKQLYAIVEPILRTKTNEEWMEIFEGAPFPYGPVNDMAQAFDNEHVKNIGIVQDVDCSYNAKLKMVGPAVTFKNSSNKIRREPPLLGQHTDEVLTSLGYTAKEIELLRSKRVI